MQLNDTDGGSNGGPVDVKIKVISDDDKDSKGNKEQDRLDDELTVRALKRKQERIDEHNEEKKMNAREKKKA